MNYLLYLIFLTTIIFFLFFFYFFSSFFIFSSSSFFSIVNELSSKLLILLLDLLSSYKSLFSFTNQHRTLWFYYLQLMQYPSKWPRRQWYLKKNIKLYQQYLIYYTAHVQFQDWMKIVLIYNSQYNFNWIGIICFHIKTISHLNKIKIVHCATL